MSVSMVGKYEQRVVRPECRRLTSLCASSLKQYLCQVDTQMDVHNMESRLAEASWGANTYPASPEVAAKLERLNVQMSEIQTTAKDKCRRLIRASMPYSKPAKVWRKRKQSYKELINRLEGKVKNSSNIIRQANSLGIPNPKKLTTLQLEDGV